MRFFLMGLQIVLYFIPSMGLSAIFGNDDRSRITPRSASYQKARSTAVAVLSSLVEKSGPGTIRILTDSIPHLCSEEKFRTDPSLQWACTGFLISPDLLVTAGHCMVNTGESHHEKQTYCKAFSWLFDYHADEQGKFNTESLPRENLYRCKEVIYSVVDEALPFRDFAIVKLERPVPDRAPLKLTKKPLATNAVLSMIGYPFGTPAKLTSSGRILLNDLSRQSFITNLDAFAGNSGSPVFNTSEEVVGILVGGTPISAFYYDPVKSCSRLNVCDQKGDQCKIPEDNIPFFQGFQRIGSEVQRASSIIEAVEKIQGEGLHLMNVKF